MPGIASASPVESALEAAPIRLAQLAQADLPTQTARRNSNIDQLPSLGDDVAITPKQLFDLAKACREGCIAESKMLGGNPVAIQIWIARCIADCVKDNKDIIAVSEPLDSDMLSVEAN